MLLPLSVLAQSTLTGTVVDSKTQQPISGVNVLIAGATTGASTGFDGKFTIKNIKIGDKINFTFVGYKKSTITYTDQKNLVVSLIEDSNELKEVVVQVGYGSTKKKDATGAVTIITSKDFNKGAITSADQLLAGKAPGVRITSSGGAPDSAPNIRIRGGSSLNASNNPLIVIDGIPIDNVNPAGIANPLSLVNPNDIESFSILKDASATAIYGSRASNGVIIITTKKGISGKPQFNYSAITSIGYIGDNQKIDVMDGPTYRKFIETNFPAQANLLGYTEIIKGIPTKLYADTKWQNQIYRQSLTYEHNFSARANLFNKLPIRASIGYLNNEGLVKTNDYKRFSASLKLTPSFLNNNLKVDFNAKYLKVNKNAIDDGGAIGGALNMDPTKPIYDNSPSNIFGGYYQENSSTGLRGSRNPLAILEQRTRPEKVDKLLANIQLDYKLPFFPAIKAVVNAGIDASKSNVVERFADNAIGSYALNLGATSGQLPYTFNPGINYVENQTITNRLLDAYLVYDKPLKGFISKFNLTAGHSFQSFLIIGDKEIYANNAVTGSRELRPDKITNPTNKYKSPYAIESYFARSNFDLKNKYLFTVTVRADGSSLFQPSKRWGYFPAAGFAWKMKDESFLVNSSSIKDLKLRLGYGITGQNDIIEAGGYFPSSPLFSAAGTSSQYFPGVQSYTALPFNFGLTWEKTATYNAGIDFEILEKGIINGSLDVYQRNTSDLLAKVPASQGQSLTNVSIRNVGSLVNKGVELNLNLKAIQSDNVNLNFNTNISYNKGEVTDLNNVTEVADEKNKVPGIGQELIFNIVGKEPYSAKVFEQIYDGNGQPLKGAYVDRNSDGAITDDDKYVTALRPNLTFGFGTTFNYKNVDLTATFRGQKGGKTYNVRNYQGQVIDNAYDPVGNSLGNILNGDLPFKNRIDIVFSDYFLEDASFIRCENITLGYKFNNTAKGTTVRMFLAANNLFIITKYSGQDPENFSSIDTNFYPRPRLFSLGVNIDF